MIMMGLRLTEGIKVDKLFNKEFFHKKNVDILIRKQILKIQNNKMFVNEKYLVKLNSILNKIINN